MNDYNSVFQGIASLVLVSKFGKAVQFVNYVRSLYLKISAFVDKFNGLADNYEINKEIAATDHFIPNILITRFIPSPY